MDAKDTNNGRASGESAASNNNNKVATKAIRSLLSIPHNRTCADCKSALVDLSQIHASFCPKGRQILDHSKSSRVACFSDFGLTHQSFAPPNLQKENVIKYGTDPALSINQKFGGHAVFLCVDCAKAHSSLPPTVAIVYPVQDEESRLREEHATYMKEYGGNARSWIVYEHSIPDAWEKRRPGPTSSLQERLLFARAKYETLSFCFPPPGPLSNDAWLRILDRHSSEFQRYTSLDLLRNYRHLSPTNQSSSQNNNKNVFKPEARPTSGGRSTDDSMPNRLIDFFCVVSCSMQLDPSELNRTRHIFSSLRSIEDLRFTPTVSDCFPKQTSYNDTEFPTHLATFVLPEGCRPWLKPKPPKFFSTALTTAEGDRLYSAVLQIWDEHVDVSSVRSAVMESGLNQEELPEFLSTSHPDSGECVFFPKCLVLISHYGWFDLFRKVLLQLYRITLVEAPLPIERYIANVACEIPLPPQGRIKIEFGFTSDEPWTFERPAMNQLPLANFSYRPLFASLSVGNIITVIGCLLEESRVVLLSKYYSILCPVAEALLSLMFPFTWQGLYIPVLPYAMTDCLEAPVPFLIGLHSRFLQETEPGKRPRGVVFVDLDRDVIYLGVDEHTGQNRELPSLPLRDALKLKKALETYGGSSVYLIPDSGIKGCIMTGDGTLMLNEERKSYCRMENVLVNPDSLGRTEIFSVTDKAYRDGDLSATITGFGTVHGRLDDYEADSETGTSKSSAKRDKRKKKPFFLRVRKPASMSDFEGALEQDHLLEMATPDGFSVTEIRNAFLRFFVTLFRGYQGFLLDDQDDLFDEDDFVDDLKLNDNSPEFLQRFLQTQMFQRFLEERQDNPDHPEMRFFDESIIAKNNRSKKYTLATGGKKPTPFLDDVSGKVTKTFTPPPPSNLGLPDDGSYYHYGSFPSLDYSLFGRIRPPALWPDLGHSSGRIRMSTRALKTQQEIVNKAMKPLLLAPAAMMSMARRSAKDLEAALNALSPVFSNSSGRDVNAGKDKRRRGETNPVASTETASTTKSSVSTLSRADALILNARRKQGILLVLVVTIQACWRRHVALSQFKNIRRAISQLQRAFRSHRDKTARSSRRLRRIVTIQTLARRFLAQAEKRTKLGSVQLIQRWNRGRMVRTRFKELRKAATTIQAITRQRRTHFIYDLVRKLVSMVQARVRGVLVRKQINDIMDIRMVLYQRHLFTLWQKTHTSLSFRTKLWSDVWPSWGTFSSCRVVENELIRQWDLLELHLRSGDVDARENGIGSVIEIRNDVFQWCLHVEAQLENLDNSKPGLKAAMEYEDAERLQIYERLSSCSQEDLASFYDDFGIPRNDAKKKVQLANIIWTKYAQVGKSVSAMLSLFHELEDSATISFVKPSAKGKRRIPHSRICDLTPNSNTPWGSASLAGLVRKDNQELAMASSKETLNRVTEVTESRTKSNVDDQVRRNALMESNGFNDWNECRSVLIQKYLFGQNGQLDRDICDFQTSGDNCNTDKPRVEQLGLLDVGFPEIPLSADVDPKFPDVFMTSEAIDDETTDSVHFPIEI